MNVNDLLNIVESKKVQSEEKLDTKKKHAFDEVMDDISKNWVGGNFDNDASELIFLRQKIERIEREYQLNISELRSDLKMALDQKRELERKALSLNKYLENSKNGSSLIFFKKFISMTKFWPDSYFFFLDDIFTKCTTEEFVKISTKEFSGTVTYINQAKVFFCENLKIVEMRLSEATIGRPNYEFRLNRDAFAQWLNDSH